MGHGSDVNFSTVFLSLNISFSQAFFSLWKLTLMQILMNFDLGYFPLFSLSLSSLSLSSLCVIYPRGRSVHKKKKQYNAIVLSKFSLWQTLMKFVLGQLNFSFSQSFFSLCNLPLEKVILHKKHKKFFLSLSSLCGSTPRCKSY